MGVETQESTTLPTPWQGQVSGLRQEHLQFYPLGSTPLELSWEVGFSSLKTNYKVGAQHKQAQKMPFSQLRVFFSKFNP
jgi:hypothetical protein